MELKEMNIYQRVNAVMQECQYMQKVGAAQGKGVKYDEVVGMIRNLLIKYGIAPVVNQHSLDLVQSSTKQPVYQGSYTLDLVNIDKPEEKITHTAIAHGMDGGDKGPGKAHTYATKIMLVKAFLIETGEDEESREERQEKKTISAAQEKELGNYCFANGEWTQTGLKLAKAYNISYLTELPAIKFNEALERCKAAANGNS